MASIDDVVTVLRQIAVNLSQIVQKITTTFPRGAGSFTMPAATSTTIADNTVTANSKIMLSATNPSAGTLMGSAKALYISAKAPGASFTVATANATNAAGTETFDYTITNPA